MITLRKLTKSSDGVEIRLEIESEDIQPNFDSGEPDADAEITQEIEQRLSEGDTWAWCTVTVSASWGGWVGTSILGGCSYENEADFKENGDYESMAEEAVDNLNEKIAKSAQAISNLIDFAAGFSK